MTDNRKRKKGRLEKAGKITSGAGNLVKGVGSLLEAIGGNHPAWYEAYPLDGLVAINFGEREKIGKTIPWENYNLRSPSDCKISLSLTIPTSTGKDAFKESHQIIMNKLRAATGSNVTYTIDDLMKYTLNARELVALYTVIRRTILCTRIVDIYDSDAPYKYAMFSASGNQSVTTMPYATLTANLATDTVRLNRLGMVISSLVPIRMNLMARTAWLFSNIFADSKTRKFSTKMFTLGQTGFWDTQQDGSIGRNIQTLNGLTISQMLDILESNLNSFSNQLQNSRIAGDYLKAFGDFFTRFQGIDENTRIVPIYDEAALTQIQNLTMVGNFSVDSYYSAAGIPTTIVRVSIPGQDLNDTTKFDNSHRGARIVTAPYTAFQSDCIVNTYKDHVTPGEAISLSRLVALTSDDTSSWVIASSGGSSTVNVSLAACGTEVAENLFYLNTITPGSGLSCYTLAAPLGRFTETGDTYIRFNSAFYWALRDTLELAEFWSMDDWAPRFITSIKAPNPPATIPDASTGAWDYSNWGKLSKENLSTYHQVATMSLLATPDVIKEQSNFQFV